MKKPNQKTKTSRLSPKDPKVKSTDRSAKINAAVFIKRLSALRSAAELKKYHRYFTFEEGPSAKGDRFIGVRMGHVFNLAKEFIAMAPAEIEKLLESEIHEVRAGGCSVMGKQASDKKTRESRRKELYDLYLRRHDRINDWDLVDLASYKVVGSYLYDYNKPRTILYKLAKSKNKWERRTAIVSTAYFIRKGEVDDAYLIAEMLVNDPEDTVHKATGWMLRYAGDNKNRPRLLAFLDTYAATLPRIFLRNALEHLNPKQREYYQGVKKANSV